MKLTLVWLVLVHNFFFLIHQINFRLVSITYIYLIDI